MSIVRAKITCEDLNLSMTSQGLISRWRAVFLAIFVGLCHTAAAPPKSWQMKQRPASKLHILLSQICVGALLTKVSVRKWDLRILQVFWNHWYLPGRRCLTLLNTQNVFWAKVLCELSETVIGMSDQPTVSVSNVFVTLTSSVDKNVITFA